MQDMLMHSHTGELGSHMPQSKNQNVEEQKQYYNKVNKECKISPHQKKKKEKKEERNRKSLKKRKPKRS